MKVSTIICQVSDMDRAVGFYRDVLELPTGMVSQWWSTVKLGDVEIGFHPPFEGEARAIGRGWILGLEVDDIKALRERLEKHKVLCAAYHDIPGGVVMDFMDAEGYPIQAMQKGVSSKELG